MDKIPHALLLVGEEKTALQIIRSFRSFGPLRDRRGLFYTC